MHRQMWRNQTSQLCRCPGVPEVFVGLRKQENSQNLWKNCYICFDTDHLLKLWYPPSWEWYSRMAAASFSRIIHPPTLQQWFQEHNNDFDVLTWPSNSQDFNPIKGLWDMLQKEVQSIKAPPSNIHELKDPLVVAWCRIPQCTATGLGGGFHAWKLNLLKICRVVILLWLIMDSFISW